MNGKKRSAENSHRSLKRPSDYRAMQYSVSLFCVL